MKNEFISLSGKAIAESPETLVQHVTHKLEVLKDPQRHEGKAFCSLTEDLALQAAEESAQRHAQGQTLGPLDGCVVSIKDMYDMAGQITMAGTSARASAAPAREDATAVARLKKAGAIIIGRTNMSEFAFSAIGINKQFSTPGNPHDLSRIPGGSSSGAAASVGYGICDIGLGSDTGGSVRIPAALCGLTGFKPTSGRIPLKGTFALSTTLDTVGPLAPTVSACAQTFMVLSGQTPDFFSQQVKRLPSSYRIGVVRSAALYNPAEPAVMEAMKISEQALRLTGMQLFDVDISPLLSDLAQLDQIGLFPAIELAANIFDYLPEQIGKIDPYTWTRIKAGYLVSATSYINMAAKRKRMIARMDAILEEYDALILPTVPITAPTIDSISNEDEFKRINGLLLLNTRLANLADLPAISLPLPVDGLPVGLMAWGKRNQDEHLLSVAYDIEQALAERFSAL